MDNDELSEDEKRIKPRFRLIQKKLIDVTIPDEFMKGTDQDKLLISALYRIEHKIDNNDSYMLEIGNAVVELDVESQLQNIWIRRERRFRERITGGWGKIAWIGTSIIIPLVLIYLSKHW